MVASVRVDLRSLLVEAEGRVVLLVPVRRGDRLRSSIEPLGSEFIAGEEERFGDAEGESVGTELLVVIMEESWRSFSLEQAFETVPRES